MLLARLRIFNFSFNFVFNLSVNIYATNFQFLTVVNIAQILKSNRSLTLLNEEKIPAMIKAQ